MDRLGRGVPLMRAMTRLDASAGESAASVCVLIRGSTDDATGCPRRSAVERAALWRGAPSAPAVPPRAPEEQLQLNHGSHGRPRKLQRRDAPSVEASPMRAPVAPASPVVFPSARPDM